MSLNADALAYLADKGLTLQEVVEFARIAERKKDPTNAERQARYRKNKGAKDNALRNAVTPPNEYISNPPVSPSPDGDTPSSEIEIVVSDWNDMAKRSGLPSVRGKLDPQRQAMIRSRLRDAGLDGVREAIAAVERSPFCRGELGNWRADLKFLLRPGNFSKLREGGFDPPTLKRTGANDTLLAQAERYRGIA